jgi:AcrR family transcriptional regulator
MVDERDRQVRRREAIREARRILGEEGVGALSMRRLAKASKMAVNTLYAMFSTRDGILQAIVEDTIAERVARLSKVEGGADPVERLDALVRASLQHAVDNPGLFKPMYRALTDQRALKWRVQEVGAGFFAARIDEAVAAGQLRDDTDAASLARVLFEVAHDSSLAWAHDEIDAAALEARSLHAVAVIVAASASDALAPQAQRRLAVATARLRG